MDPGHNEPEPGHNFLSTAWVWNKRFPCQEFPLWRSRQRQLVLCHEFENAPSDVSGYPLLPLPHRHLINFPDHLSPGGNRFPKIFRRGEPATNRDPVIRRGIVREQRLALIAPAAENTFDRAEAAVSVDELIHSR